jgi:hypothetical protein
MLCVFRSLRTLLEYSLEEGAKCSRAGGLGRLAYEREIVEKHKRV